MVLDLPKLVHNPHPICDLPMSCNTYLSALVFLFVTLSCGTQPLSAQPPSVIPVQLRDAKVETYKQIGDVTLRLFVFEPTGHQASDSRPAAVFFFGGGWKSGSPTQFEPHCRYLASRGMVAITAEYRVESRNQTSPFECVKDGKSAMRWVRANAERLGIDPQRIAAGGGSAGGHVAAASATLPGLNEANEDLGTSCQPNALLLFNPVYENGPGGYGFDRVKDRYLEISPFHNIKTGVPPTIVFFGTQDHLVPVATVKEFDAKLAAVGTRCDTHLYEGQGHGFFNRGKEDGKYYAATVHQMDRFLSSLGWLRGEPAIDLPELATEKL